MIKSYKFAAGLSRLEPRQSNAGSFFWMLSGSAVEQLGLCRQDAPAFRLMGLLPGALRSAARDRAGLVGWPWLVVDFE